jgi:hypothetical protein
VTLSGGTANGVAYLNGSKVVTSGSALVFDGTNLGVGAAPVLGTSSVNTTSSGTTANGYFSLVNGFAAAFVGVNNTGGTVRGVSANSVGFGTADGAPLTFGTNNAERMRLDASGNLALGSTSILGSTNRASFTNTVSAKGVLALSNTSSSGYSAIELYDNAGGQQGAVGWGNGSVAVTGAQNATYLYSSGAITFLSGGTSERARIDSSGNLLVGTTSSFWSNSGRGVIEVNGSSTALIGLKTGNTARGYIYTQGTDLIVSSSSGTCTLQTAAATPVVFATDNVERARITSGGALLVGTTGASLGASTFFKESGATTPCVTLVKNSSSSSTDQAFCVQNGNAGGTTSFQVLANGNAQNTNNSYGAISDAKLKDVIGKAPSYWDKFKQYEFVNYTLKADKSKLKLLGLVAQQVEQISSSLIEELPDADKDGNSLGTTTKGIKYSVVALQAEVVLQEAQTRIEQLEAIIESLKARLDAANL